MPDDLDERLNTISRDLELMRQMQLDSMRREERYERRFQAFRKAVIGSVRAERKARLAARDEANEAYERFDTAYDQFFGDLEDGEHNGDEN